MEKQYLDLMNRILNDGIIKENRTGINTIAVPPTMIQHNMSDGFPLLTTKKMGIKSISAELEFFIKGKTDKKWLKDRKCNIWNEWCTPLKVPASIDDKERKSIQAKTNDLGPIYGYNWRNFNKTYQPLQELPDNIEANFHGGFINIKKETEFTILWKTMISRCYDKTHQQYKLFGAKGDYVCDRWLVYSNFLEDVKNIKGYEFSTISKHENIDLIKNSREYSLKNVFWTKVKNYDYDEPIVAIDPNGNEFLFSDIESCAYNTPFSVSQIENILNKTRLNGWSFEKTTDEQIYDQFDSIVEKLKSNPDDRRMLCSAWNPQQLSEMALPPCHFVFGVQVLGGKLNLWWAQRSVDVFLGLGYNIASYALLLKLLAKESGLEEGILTGFLSDVHIYENHIEQVKTQLEREPYNLPELNITNFTSIYDWEYTDVELSDYTSHPRIKADVAI